MSRKVTNVLLIEKDRSAQEAFKQWIKDKDPSYDSTIVTSFSEARERLVSKKEIFDVVLLNYFPGGEEEFGIFKEFIETPFIICVNSGDEGSAVEAVKAGACDYVVKDPAGNYLTLLPLTVESVVRQNRLARIRKREKEELTAAVLKNKALLRAIPDMMFVNTRNGTYVDFKADSEELLAIPPDEIRGKTTKDTGFAPEYLKLIQESIKIVLDTGEMRTLEYELKTPAGLGHYEARIVRLDRDSVLTIVRDITDRKRMHEELLKHKNLESIGILAAGIAHDFNNLLTGVLGNISLALMYVTADDKLHKMLTGAQKTAVEAAELVERLIFFSKEEWLNREEVSLFHVVKHALQLFPEDEPPLYDMDIPDNLNPIFGDESQLSQVIYNLLYNATEAMKDLPQKVPVLLRAGNVEIDMENKFSLKKGRYVKISIQDRGRGIAKENVHKIFAPYFSTKQDRGPKGTGLGLAIAYAVVKNHQGNIMVESEVGKGTTIDVYLPAISEGVYFLKERIHTVPREEDKGRVLLMDDDPMIVDITSEMLEQLGYRVDACREGSEVLEAYKSAKETFEDFDIVVLDIVNKVGMEGRETMQRLKDFDPDVRSIAISGYLHDFDPDELKTCGFNAVLAKPYRIEDLMETINGVLAP